MHDSSGSSDSTDTPGLSETAARIHFASAGSDLPDTKDAIEQVLEQLIGKVAGRIDLAVVFVTSHHRDYFERICDRLRSALSPRTMIGNTCEGVIANKQEHERVPGLSVMIGTLPGATIESFVTDQVDFTEAGESPEDVRQQIAPTSMMGLSPKTILMVADPFSTAMLSVLPAFDAAFPHTPVIGGMASGASHPRGNRLVLNDRILDAGGVGVAIGGDVQVDYTVSQGCRAIGKPLVITKAQRHVVMQLAGRNAMEVVRDLVETLAEEDRHLIQNHGLQVGRVIDEYKERFGRGDFLIRGVHGIDDEQGFIAIADPQVRVGQTIQFHLRDQQTARDDFSLMLESQQLHGPAAGALLFSCNGRGTRLFDEANADANMVTTALSDAPLAGFFAAGEIGPVGGSNFVHGHTASLVVFREMEG